MIQCRGGGFTGIYRRGIDHHSNGLSMDVPVSGESRRNLPRSFVIILSLT
jgi:hypothetical protein